MNALTSRRPEWSAWIGIFLAWLAFGWLAEPLPRETKPPGLAGATSVAHHGPSGRSVTDVPAMDWSVVFNYLHGVGLWALMVIAMMLPSALPLVRYVAFATRPVRRQRSIAVFCLGYLAGWLPIGAVVSVWHLLDLPADVVMVVSATALTAAAVWELLPVKKRALRRCHRTMPIRYTGRAADSSALRFGLVSGRSCVLACGPAMIALVTLGHPLIPTIVVAAAMTLQALHARGDQWRGYVAALGFVGACAVVAG